MNGFEARALLQAMGIPGLVQGRSRATFALAGSGQRSDDVARELSGTLNLAMTDSCRLGLDLNRLWIDAQKGPIKGWNGLNARETSFDELDAQLTISKGALTAKRLEAKIGEVTLSATGSADLLNKTLDVRLSSRGRSSPSLPGDIAAALAPQSGSKVAISPLLLTGTAMQPLIQFGPAAQQNSFSLDGLLGSPVQPTPSVTVTGSHP